MNVCEVEKKVAKLRVESVSGSGSDDDGSDVSTEAEESEEDDNCLLDDEADEEDNEYNRLSSKVQGLFCEQEFENVVALFSHEFKVNKFNLVSLVKKYDLDMISYIKLINFIRSQKPNVEVFNKSYESPEDFPWNDDCYLKTVVENDAALQFDVEEDLDLLESKLSEKSTNGTNGHGSHENESVRVYKAKLKESQAKIEELTEIVEKLRAFGNNLLNMSSAAGETKSVSGKPDDLPSVEDDSVYVNSYSNYAIHLEMLQDTVRTQGYMDAIMGNPNAFKDKVVLDVGCGSGILSMFAAKAGAKLVIAVDMSNIIDQATQIAKENGFGSDKIVFLKGKVEEVKLPVSNVDIIISEWMGYFLLYESMLDSVITARDKYLINNDQTKGLVLPNFFEMHLYGVDDKANHDKFLSYWSNVYGFKMSCMREIIKKDAQVLDIDKQCIISDLCVFKTIDCSTCTADDIRQFESEFTLTIARDGQLTGLASSFDTFFNDQRLEKKLSFSTSPMHTQTHWQQTLFQFDEPFAVKKGQVVKGKIECMKNPDYLRSYLIKLSLFDKSFKYILD